MVLSRRALNRALLARQMLLRPVKLSAAATIERLVGMQAQAPNLPYVGLWARLQGFRHEELSELVRSKRAVRTSLMRNTIHLVTTEDARRLKPVFQPLHERGFFRGSPWGRDLKTMNPDALLEAGREIMGERPRTIAELARLLAPRFPNHDAQSLAYGVRYLLPMVFATPRGIWQAGGPVALPTVKAGVGRSDSAAIAPEEPCFATWGLSDQRHRPTCAPGRLAMRPARKVRPGWSRSKMSTDRAVRRAEIARPAADTAAPVVFARLRQHSSRRRPHADLAPGQHWPFQQQRIMKGRSSSTGSCGRLKPDQGEDGNNAGHHPVR
jgi:hypothetical protein